ncbi:uncharacterized protein M6B38_378540 [Iris pallida]|uniref:Large ribosomal subunit protein uL4m n=1 Tax=Iris pallida TaxID=29817 RepID=A0AAX6G8V2_IRIPA|nr:uncharacterized protein M6B38_378540 [Iris pallida]
MASRLISRISRGGLLQSFSTCFHSPRHCRTSISSAKCPWSFVSYKKFSSTYEPQASEGLIPPELLTSKKVLTPDRVIGQYADLVTRVTNFHNEDKGLMVLAGDVFDVPIRKDIIHRVVRWQLAKRQQGTHSTKTISEVSGTGRKPYPQKGTGQARHGTLRGPQFRHGATMHGPKPRSHAIKLQKKVRRLGLKIALSARIGEGKASAFSPLPQHSEHEVFFGYFFFSCGFPDRCHYLVFTFLFLASHVDPDFTLVFILCWVFCCYSNSLQ